MISPSSNWNTAVANPFRKPVIVVDIDGLQYSGSDVFFATGDFSGITSGYKKLLTLDMDAELFRIDFLAGSFNALRYRFQVIDGDDLIFTDILNNYDLSERKVTIKIGFASLAIADFYSLPDGYIYDMQLLGDLMTYEIEADLPLFYLNRFIIQKFAETQLVVADSGSFTISSGTATESSSVIETNMAEGLKITLNTEGGTRTAVPVIQSIIDNTSFTVIAGNADTSTYDWELDRVTKTQVDIYVNDLSEFYSDFTPVTRNKHLLRIGDEIIDYDAVNSSPDFFEVQGTRGPFSSSFGGLFFNSPVDEHLVPAEVRQIHFLWGHDVAGFGEIMARLLVSSTAGTNGDYDTGLESWGAEVNESLVDVQSLISNWQKNYGGTDVGLHTVDHLFSFYVDQKLTFNEMLERMFIQMAKPAIPYVNSSGKIDVFYPNPIYDESVGAIDESDVLNLSIRIMTSELINVVHWVFPEDNVSLTYDSLPLVKIVKHDQSISDYGEKSPLEIKVPQGVSYNNLLSSLTDWSFKFISWRLLALFGQRNAEFDIEVQWGAQLFEIGDVVSLTHSLIPDWVNNGRGITSIDGYVIAKRFNMTNTVSYTIKCFGIFANDTDPVLSKTEVTPDDTTLSVESNKTVTIQSQDAHYDNTATSHPGSQFIFEITFTPPNTATTTIDYAEIALSAISAAAFDIQQTFYVPYKPSESTAFTRQFLLFFDSEITPDTLKVDFVDTRSGVVADRPTITFDKLTFVRSNVTLTFSE